MKKTIFLVIIVLLFVVAAGASAQTSLTNESLSLSINPRYPEPNSVVSMRVGNTELNLNNSTISWYVNGIFEESGIGQIFFKYRVGSLGSVFVIKAIIKDEVGNIFQISANITPVIIDVLWDSSAYIPPFYKGKALSGRKSLVKLTAMPLVFDSRGVKLSPNNLRYDWKTRDGVNIAGSGLGKKTFSFTSDTISLPTPITLTIYNRAGGIVGEKSVFFDIYEPEVIVYINDPLLGILFNNAVGDKINIDAEEFSLEAFPYFFGVKNRRNSSVVYKWEMNSVGLDSKNSSSVGATFRKGNGGGTSSISVLVDNIRNIFEAGRKSILIESEE